MSVQAWLMLLFAMVMLGGGLTICITIAVRTDRRKRERGVGFFDEGDD